MAAPKAARYNYKGAAGEPNIDIPPVKAPNFANERAKATIDDDAEENYAVSKIVATVNYWQDFM